MNGTLPRSLRAFLQPKLASRGHPNVAGQRHNRGCSRDRFWVRLAGCAGGRRRLLLATLPLYSELRPL